MAGLKCEKVLWQLVAGFWNSCGCVWCRNWEDWVSVHESVTQWLIINENTNGTGDERKSITLLQVTWKVLRFSRWTGFTVLPFLPYPPPTTPSPHFHPTHPHYHPCFCLVCILTEQDVQFLPVFTYVHTSYWYCNYYYYWVPRSHYWNRLELLQG